MKDSNTQWYYKLHDGKRTHYACNDAIDVLIECNSKKQAELTCEALNGEPQARQTLSQFLVQKLEAVWPNLYMEGWDGDEADKIMMSAIGKWKFGPKTVAAIAAAEQAGAA